MCGIVGYIGGKNSVPLLLDGLSRLEYRGYDSAGVAVLSDGAISILRRQGNLQELRTALDGNLLEGYVGIGHTRWATHGAPCERNAHPHLDCTGKIAVVHNGIIENFLTLREELTARGHRLISDTDTETLAHLIEEAYQGDLAEAVRQALRRVRGSFALAVLSQDQPDKIVAARRDSPLILGIGQDECFVASDIPAVIGQTRDVFILENDELAEVSRQGYSVTTLDRQAIDRPLMRVKWDAAAAEKAGYEDFMLKEIFEQPVALRETIRAHLQNDKVTLGEGDLTPEILKKLNRIFIVACGTSYHAGLVARSTIESWVGLPVDIDIASEFRYRDPILGKDSLVIAITQSGETADTLASVREAKKRGAFVAAVSNVVGSSVTREADATIYTHAGPEIGVAATKTLVSQMSALHLFALFLADARGAVPGLDTAQLISEIKSLPELVKKTLESANQIKACSKLYADRTDFLFLGRGVGLPVALEGALKLKEISYIHAEGYAAGEMKHGPIALVEKAVPVVAVATRSHVYEKVLGNIQEVKARNAEVIAVATEGDEDIRKHADQVFYVPETSEILSAIPAVVPLQLLAYYIAKERGCNVDQPRNLAKSVTVE